MNNKLASILALGEICASSNNNPIINKNTVNESKKTRRRKEKKLKNKNRFKNKKGKRK